MNKVRFRGIDNLAKVTWLLRRADGARTTAGFSPQPLLGIGVVGAQRVSCGIFTWEFKSGSSIFLRRFETGNWLVPLVANQPSEEGTLSARPRVYDFIPREESALSLEGSYLCIQQLAGWRMLTFLAFPPDPWHSRGPSPGVEAAHYLVMWRWKSTRHGQGGNSCREQIRFKRPTT